MSDDLSAISKKLQEIRSFLAEYKNRETRYLALTGGGLKQTEDELQKAERHFASAKDALETMQKKLTTQRNEIVFQKEWLEKNADRYSSLEALTSSAAQKLAEKITKLASEAAS